MPSKPDIKYKTLEIPAGLISIANELAEICLKTKQEEQITLLTMQNVLELFIKSYPEYVQYEYINNASDISNITIAGFTIYCNGDIDFNIKNIVSENPDIFEGYTDGKGHINWPTNYMGLIRLEAAQNSDAGMLFIGYGMAFLVLWFYTIFFLYNDKINEYLTKF